MEKALSHNEMVDRARHFSATWVGETYERGESQSFWTALLDVFGVDRRRVGASFERRAVRSSTGRTGYIDVFWPGIFLAEQKSHGRSLTDARDQAFDYLPSLSDSEHPRVVAVCDFATLRFWYLDGTSPGEPVDVPLGGLADHLDKFAFLTGARDRAVAEQEAANAEAVTRLGALYAALNEALSPANAADDTAALADEREHEISVLLMRLLFLMFGDDTDLWPRGLFHDYVSEHTSLDGTDVGGQLASLFQTLNTPEKRRPQNLAYELERFPYVNGGLFSPQGNVQIPVFDRNMREILRDCCRYDWRDLSPEIFGSMFQVIKSREARRSGGEHCTTETNILRTLRPLFLDELHAEMEDCGSNLNRLKQLHRRLGLLRVLDPACGCGNFLIVAYRELRHLELDILRRIVALTGQDMLGFDVTAALVVSPAQFYGIEIEEWPARIAETAFFIVDHQANRSTAAEFGDAPNRLPITVTADIRIGNALRTDWGTVLPPSDEVIVVGNPPFGGDRGLSREQKNDLQAAWGGRKTSHLDYVTGWYAKAVDYLRSHTARWAFVSTNSISQGEPVADLWPKILDAGWRCRFAHRSFRWDSDAPGKAAVHVSILGFDRSRSSRPRLWTYPESGVGDPSIHDVPTISPYLSPGPNVLVRSRSTPLSKDLPTASFGNMARDGGALLVEPDEVEEVRDDPIAARYLRRFIGANELLYGSGLSVVPDACSASSGSWRLLRSRP